jgi:hypothetical protein
VIGHSRHSLSDGTQSVLDASPKLWFDSVHQEGWLAGEGLSGQGHMPPSMSLASAPCSPEVPEMRSGPCRRDAGAFI